MGTVDASAFGHGEITATHVKTLEVARATDIGRTATCVIAVGGSLDETAIAELRGVVDLTIAAGGRSAVIRARANPAFRPGDPLIVRREAAITRSAVLVAADTSAADLDRNLVANLAVPGAPVSLTFREVAGGTATGALVVNLAAEWRAAGDDERPSDIAFSSRLDESAIVEAAEALAAGKRVALCRELSDPGATAVVRNAHASGHAVLPATGLAPVAAALATAAVPVVAVELVRYGRRKPRPLAPGTTRVTFGVPGDQVIEQLCVGDVGLIALDVGGRREQFLSWHAGASPVIQGGRGRTAVVVTHRSVDEDNHLDDMAHRCAAAMLAEGMPVIQIARAIAAATGRHRSEVYDHVLAVRDAQKG